MGLQAPFLDPAWLAQAFPWQVAQIEEVLEESDGAIGYGWGAWLLLCAMCGLVERGWRPCPTLLLACFMERGRFTGNEGLDYSLPRTQEVGCALKRGGRLTGAPIRFVHGTEDRQAELSRLAFVEEEGFALRRVPAGHLLLGQAKAAIEEELKRLRRAIQHASGR
jgi:hypothetical protein